LAVTLIHMHHVPLDTVTFLVVTLVSVAAGVAFNQLCDKPVQRLLRRQRATDEIGVWPIIGSVRQWGSGSR